DFRRLALHHLVALRLEIAPERFEQRLPLRAPARHVIELFLHSCREVIGNIAGEEALEKGSQEAARILCKETILFGADVSPVLQDLDRRGVSRGPADAELLEPLDQARFGKARRRLREVLVGSDAELRRR